MPARSKPSKRGGVRRKTFQTGFIAYGRAPKTRRICFIRDICAEGARIELAEVFSPPPHFVLEIREALRPRNAHVVWRDGRHVGVSFRETEGLVEAMAPLARWPA